MPKPLELTVIREDRSSGWLAVALLALLQIALWKARVHDAASVPGIELGVLDHFVEHHPMMLLAARRLLAGELPLWNPHELCGMPLLAVPHVGVFYPPNLLFLVLDPAIAEEVALVLHLAFAAGCTYGLVRAWGATTVASVAAGIAFAWCGRMNTLVNQHAPLIVLCWLPATVWFVERAIRRKRFAGAQLALAVCAQVLAGSHEGVLLNLQAAGLYTVARIGPEAFGSRAAAAWSSGLGLLGAVFLGFVLAAPQLLPTLELLARSDRLGQELTLEQARHVGTIPPGDVVRMLASNRSTLPEHLRWAHVHAGFLSLLAAALGFGVKRMRRLWVYALLLCVLALLLTAGGAVFELYFATPIGENFRRPWKALAYLEFGLALLTAAGVTRLEDWAREPAARTRRRPLLAATLALGVGLVAWGGIGWASAAVLAGITLLGMVSQPALRRIVVLGLVTTSSVQLFLSFENRHLRILRQPHALNREAPFWREVATISGEARLLTSGLMEYDPALTGKQAVIRGLSFTGGHESLATRRHSLFFAASRAVPHMSTRFYGASELPANLRPEIFDRAATRLYLLRANEELARALSQPAVARRRGFQRLNLPAPENVAVFERKDALPRVRFAADVEPVADLIGARVALGAHGAEPRRPILEPAGDAPAGRGDPAATARLQLRRVEPERIEIDVEASGPGYVVLADTFYPGWRASVDGRDAPIHPADVLFRAVAVPAGDSRVVFEYRPRSLVLGFATGAAAWLLLAGLVVRTLRTSRARSAADP